MEVKHDKGWSWLIWQGEYVNHDNLEKKNCQSKLCFHHVNVKPWSREM